MDCRKSTFLIKLGNQVFAGWFWNNSESRCKTDSHTNLKMDLNPHRDTVTKIPFWAASSTSQKQKCGSGNLFSVFHQLPFSESPKSWGWCLNSTSSSPSCTVQAQYMLMTDQLAGQVQSFDIERTGVVHYQLVPGMRSEWQFKETNSLLFCGCGFHY